jgi:hypothetical protein
VSRNRLFAICATAVVLTAIALGFHEAGSPRAQRLINADRSRLEDLNQISVAINAHHSPDRKLPQTLAEASNTNPGVRLADPETGAAYEYRPLDERRFELCAVFATSNRGRANRWPQERVHSAGRQCFTYPE